MKDKIKYNKMKRFGLQRAHFVTQYWQNACVTPEQKRFDGKPSL